MVAFSRAFIGVFQGELKGKDILRIQKNFEIIFGRKEDLVRGARIYFGIFGRKEDLVRRIPLILKRNLIFGLLQNF